MSNHSKCHRLRTALPLESGNIQGMTEKAIAESSDYLISTIPNASYDTGIGIDPYHVRWGVPPIPESKYFDPRGNPSLIADTTTMPTRGPDGRSRNVTVTANDIGAVGCAMPANKIGAIGFDTFTRLLLANKWEIGPVCAWDFLDYAEPQIAALRVALHERWPKMLKDNFEYELRRQAISNSLFNYSLTAGMPYAAGGFPALPTGQLDLGFVRRIVNGPMLHHGWTGKPRVSTSQTVFETMRLNYKNLMGLNLESSLNTSETHYEDGVMSVDWAGITWVMNPEPMRGYFVTTVSGFTFVPIYPKAYREGTGGGIVPDYNTGYDDPYIWVDGTRHKVYEVTMAVHPTAFQRQGMAMPSMLDKSWDSNLFNFQVEVMDRNNGFTECNEDNMKWKWLIRHVYGFQPKNPELAFFIVHEVAPNVVNIVSVDTQFPAPTDPSGPGESTIGIQEPDPSETSSCTEEEFVECALVQAEANLEPNVDEPLPDGAPDLEETGEYLLSGGTPVYAGNDSIVQIPVTRVGGTSGTFSVTVTPTPGTASAGSDYTAGATVLTWAAGEAGTKYAPVPVLAGATPGQAFTMVVTGTPTPVDGVDTVTVNIV